MQYLKSTFLLLKDAVGLYIQDRASIYAAGLAYYTIFSVAPLLVFVTAVAGFFIGRANAGDQITLQLQYLVGQNLAGFIGDAVETLADRTVNRTATLIGFIALLVGAGGIFRQLRVAINQLWGITDIRPKTAREWLTLVRYRAIPFLMVFAVGMMLSLAVILEAIISTVRARFEVLFPQAAAMLPGFSRLLVPLLTFATFLLVFRFLPDAYSRWRDMAVGALVTTVLFLIGRQILAIFLSFSDTGSIFGAAGSVIILLFWIYYSAQILLFGAEFTFLYALRHGKPIRPKRLSTFVNEPA